MSLSSTKTVLKYLVAFGIELRPEDQTRPKMYERFGTRKIKGIHCSSPSEQSAIEKMRELRRQGHSYREIVAILNELRIPCRKPEAKWHVKTVFQCLNQSDGRKASPNNDYPKSQKC